MKVPTPPSVMPCFIALLVTLTSAGALLFAAGFLRYEAKLETNARISEFHVRTLVFLVEIKAQIVRLQREPHNVDDESAIAIDVVTTARSIQQSAEFVARLQDNSGGDVFAGTVGRILSRSNEILELAHSAEDPLLLERELGSLGLAVHQLERLHAIAVDELLAASSSGMRNDGVLIALAAGVLLISAATVLRLFTRVRDRLAQLHRANVALLETQAQLAQSQKLESIGTLVGGIAHDFNNVLTIILGNSEMLRGFLAPGHNGVESAREIQTAAERAAAMTKQLLSFSRPDFSEPQVLDVAALMEDVLPLLRHLVREDVRLELDLERPLAWTFADPVQLEQVLMNLTANASDAMPNGGRLLIHGATCELDEAEARDLQLEPGAHVKITASDNGSGMDDEVRERIFEPFFTTKVRGKGTGLGLSTVHGIVTRAGGRIRVRSNPGEGTTFEIFLVGRDPIPQTVLPGKSDPPRGMGERILIVEDEVAVRMVAANVLREAGYETFVAASAADAERICEEQQNSIDLILTDVVMPDVRGPDLAKRLVELAPRAAVVYMSGYFEKHILEHVHASNHGFVPKPFQPARLLTTVRDALDERLDRLVASGEGPN